MVTFTVVFPSRNRPLHGTFVLERVRHLTEFADVQIVAPVSWYWSLRGCAPRDDIARSLNVSHPRFWYIPGFLASFRGLSLAMSSYGTISRLRRKFDFDLIDAHFAYPDGFAAILLGRVFRRPVCITLRGTSIPQSRTFIGRWLCNWAIRRADRVIAVSENLAERARQSRIDERKIRTIPNGVDGQKFVLVDRDHARERLGLRQKGPLIVCVGHLSPRKGFHRVIRSLPTIMRQHADVFLAIVGGKGGEADNGPELRKLAKELDVAERVLFVGAQPAESVALWLGASDLFVHASDFEGCPNVVLEAMACGRPIVATKVGDTVRMVPSFAGILFDNPDDDGALSNAVSCALSRQWDSSEIRDHVLPRSWQQVARDVAKQWRIAVDRHGTEDCARLDVDSGAD